MSSEILTSPTFGRAFGRGQKGWIGLDCGVRTIKLAQLERAGGAYRLAARWTVQPPDDSVLDRDAIAAGDLKSRLGSIKGMRRFLSGRNCAAVLPMSLVDFRILDLPQSDASTERNMVAEELAAELGMEPTEFAFDYWKTEGRGGGPQKLNSVTALATPKSVVRGFAEQLLSAGLECSVLDGLPCSLARGVELIQGNDEPTIAVDLSYSTTTVVLVHRGRPVFTRVLRGGSLQSIMQPLQDGLKISADECELLLDNYGVPARSASGAVPQRVYKHAAAGLNTLVSEVDRTLHFVAQQFRNLQPQQIWLFGSGAKIKNLPEFLAERLHLPTSPWRLPGTVDASDAPFGVAAALSALAWENDE